MEVFQQPKKEDMNSHDRQIVRLGNQKNDNNILGQTIKFVRIRFHCPNQLKSKTMTTTDLKTEAVENIIIGEFVRLKANSKKTYTRNKFCQINQAYELSNYEDISDFKYVKKGTHLFIGFDY